MAEKEGIKGEIVEHLLTILGFVGAEKIFGALKNPEGKVNLAEIISGVAKTKENPHGVLLVQTLMKMRGDKEQKEALKKLVVFLQEALNKISDDRLVNLLSKLLKPDDPVASAKNLTDLVAFVSDKEIGLGFDEMMELVERDPLQAAARAKKQAEKRISVFRRHLRAATKKMKKELNPTI